MSPPIVAVGAAGLAPLAASLVPPADEPVSFEQFVAEHGVEDEKEEASCFAGPQEGISGVDGRGDQGLGSSIEDGGEQERGSDIDDHCAEELGSVDSGFGSDVLQEGAAVSMTLVSGTRKDPPRGLRL
nr:uncharacterized protein LOC127326654 isoform X2 [Lolium perenne]